ncbi:MAG: hypothetical protein ABI690_02455 [Chloroflexota bacterium]
MEAIEAAILRTVLYADLFHFPLTIREIHHFLIHDEPIDIEQIRQTLAESSNLQPYLQCIDEYVIYDGQEQLVTLRQMREAASEHLWPSAVRYAKWLARLPFVRMVALTGALAMHNAADHDDDLDYILVTAPRRVWLARAFSIVLVRLARLQGTEICPNYVLAESALVQDKHNIFMAHEIAQMVPLYGLGLYEQFRQANAWVSEQLPNTAGAFYIEAEYTPTGVGLMGKRAIEFLLGGNLGDWLEHWEYRRKLRRFEPDMKKPHSSAKLDDSHVKGHFDDHGHPVLRQFEERLTQFGLDATSATRATVPGD